MLNLISTEEKLGMSYYIKNHAFQTNDYTSAPQASMNYVLRIWNSQKQNLFKVLGNQLIVEREFHLEKTQKELERTMSDHIYRLNPYEFLREVYNLTNAGGFYEYDNRIRHLIDVPTLVKNVWDEEDFNLVLPNKLRPLRVQHGMKIMKILAKIAAAHNIDHFEDFRLAHSMALNDNIREGIMRLSIHPFDFMTLSDSHYKWSSCMEWDGGEYRAGTVEMMNSSCAVVAYIKGKEENYLDGYNDFQWPGKQWRELFLVTDKVITNVKAYPYASDGLTTFVLDWLKELVEKNTEWRYVPEAFEYNAFSYSGNFFDPLGKRICISPGTDRMYNDFSDDQKAYVAADIDESYMFVYSGPPECMWCGEETEMPNETCIVCDDCEHSMRCDCCEQVILGEVYELEGCHYCSYCYEDYARTCEISGVTRHSEHMKSLYLSPDGGRIIYTDYRITIDYDEYIGHGNSNLSDSEWSRYFKCARPQVAKTSPPDSWFQDEKVYVCLEDLTEEGKDLFWWDENSIANHSSYSERENFAFEAQKTAVDF